MDKMHKVIIVGMSQGEYGKLSKYIEVIKEFNRICLFLPEHIRDQFCFKNFEDLGICLFELYKLVLERTELRGTLLCLTDVVLYNPGVFKNISELHPGLNLRCFNLWTPKIQEEVPDKWQLVHNTNFNSVSDNDRKEEWLRQIAITILRDFLEKE
jgi:hypothetical protein